MYERELSAMGPLVLDENPASAQERLRQVLADSPVAGVAAGRLAGGKVRGMPTTVVDTLRTAALAEYVLVEADGSRGLPFKAWAPDEPVLPEMASTVVVVAGLSVIGKPLTDAHVHRAERMAGVLGVPPGSEVTHRVFVDNVRLQLSELRAASSGLRLVALLTGVESAATERLGLRVARELLGLRVEAPEVVLARLGEARAARAKAVAT
jgi:probable selenium-dependent hydroxylase accessory protein YqeC